jgi:hypothetical protein
MSINRIIIMQGGKESIIMSSASGKTAEKKKPLPKGWWKYKQPEVKP